MLYKKGQITIFVILAIIIVVIGVSYFAFRDVLRTESIPDSIDPVKLAVLDCIDASTEMGVSLLASSGGYINLPTFSAGSRYQPFSSYLSFAGSDIPYWFYMSGSNLPKTQIPTVETMETQLEDFLDKQATLCYLEHFRDSGYSITLGEAQSVVRIQDKYVDVDIKMDVAVRKNDDVAVISDHSLRFDSNLGYLFGEAVSIYEEEQATFFLENYTIDVLRLYAPVDGVELSCSPKSWQASTIYEEVRSALEFNTLQLRNRDAVDEYYNLDLESNAKVNFLYSDDWTTYFEVNPTNDNVLVAKPVGADQGMGVLGFCYVPYHFVYNFRHPVLIQVSKDDEIFQFPVTVLIEGNLPRESVGEAISPTSQISVCENKNNEVSLQVYDENLNPVDAQVSYECVGVSCDIDYVQEQNGVTDFPQCSNGVLRVDAQGYKPYKSIYSSIDSGSVAVVLEKEYEQEISLVAADNVYEDKAIITFTSEDASKTVLYPENKKVSLFEGEYDIQMYLYKSAEFTLDATTREECYDVPKSGILGTVGMTKRECSIVEVPEQVITDALVGGGNVQYYFSSEELESSRILELALDRVVVPESLEQLHTNYVLFDVADIEVSLG